MIPRTMNLAFLTSIANKGAGIMFAGAFFLAVDDLNEDAKNRSIPVTFNYTFKDTGNREAVAMRRMSDLYCNKSINVFIGPDTFCDVAGLMATAFEIPYMAFVSII